FKRASAVYKKKHNKPPVIVYDNISRLVHKNSEILDILQDDAKDNADDRKYIAVFVSSEGSVPRRMESRSAWSRADKPVIEIGDLSEKESIDYLVNKRKIVEEEAKKLYELVGGRIVDLKSVANKFLAGQSFKVIKQQILTE
ncbi:12481_t:CDS:2, partial [Ambispora gerdemannii]